MDSAHNAKQRHIERCQYRPARAWDRERRVVGRNGSTETLKRKGDFIIDSAGRKTEVKEDGWN